MGLEAFTPFLINKLKKIMQKKCIIDMNLEIKLIISKYLIYNKLIVFF